MLQFLTTEGALAQFDFPQPLIEQFPIEETTFIFSGPKFILALIAGVVMAFAFQLLFTNLAVAVVAAPDSPSSSESADSGDIKGLETKVGLALLVSVSITLFAASFLAVKLSLVSSGLLGAITGVVIWSVFFTLLVWFGSTAVGSLLGSVINTAAAGVQGLLGSATAAVGANVVKNQAVSTAEEITAAVRRELTAGLDADSIKTTLQGSLSSLQLPQLNLEQIGAQFEKLLKDANLESVADSDLLKNIDREQLVKLVSSRTDFSKQDVERVTDQLESAWKRVTGGKGSINQIDQIDQDELLKLLKSATPDNLNSEEVAGRLNQVVKSAAQVLPGGNLTGRAVQFGVTALLGKVLQNSSLSDLDVEKISGQLQTLKNKLLPPEGGSGNGSKDEARSAKTAKPFSVIQADLENYLLFSPPWELSREGVKQEFRDVIYDGAADPGIIRQELGLIDQDYFTQVLSLRDDFTPEGVQELAGYLEAIRAEVFSTVQTAETTGQSQDLRRRVEDYLRLTGKAELNPDAIGRDFQKLLEDPEAGLDQLGDRLGQFDRSTLEQILSQRQDISSEEAGQIVDQLEGTRDRVLSQAKELQERIQSEAQQLRQKVEDYLRNTNKDELNPEGIQRDLKTLFDDPQAGLSALKGRLSQFDRDTLVQLLSQRQDLSEEQVNQVLDQVESVRDGLLQAPQKLVGGAKEQYEQTTQAIAEYLRDTKLEELNPEGIKRDLQTLFADPKAGASALQSRLSQVDRETLVKLLSQRGDLSEEQMNQTIDQVQTSLRSLIKAPRRLATRVQKQAVDFEANLERYLQNTNKDELNPEGIKRDLQLLLKDPKSGFSSLGDRASKFDRSTLVALLVQREDISEEEANRIADQVQSTYSAAVGQIQQVQQAVQSTVDKGLGSVRSYLNGLERPELNYDGIKQDFSKLFDDPQVGLESLRDRVSQFDRDTLVALLSSRPDISEADANRIIDQIESTRDGVLHRIERIQQETQKRLEAVKYQTEKQVRETRKVASGAAWWVFSSAVASLAASAVAGYLAVTRLPLL